MATCYLCLNYLSLRNILLDNLNLAKFIQKHTLTNCKWKYFDIVGEFHGDVEDEKKNIQCHFYGVKVERMRYMLDKLNVRERMRLDHVIDKQTNEMLVLVDSKVSISMELMLPLYVCTRKVTDIHI